MTLKNDFTKGSIAKNILNLALPMTLAQLINLLYNIVDRIFIGRIPENATLSLTGLGLALPIITIITAFANLFGMGGAPLSAIARGRGDHEEAERIMGNSFMLLFIFGVMLTLLGLLLKKPMLYLFGASDATFPYANEYITIYLLGSIFVMIGLGMNSFINSQGFGKIGMTTILLGAVTNMILDPIFIFTLNMGVKGAAIATVISQFLSAAWILIFLRGKKTILKLKLCNLKLDKNLVCKITGLGLSGFMMAMTNSAVQIMCNASLQFYGGDLYVGVMTVLNSIREILTLPAKGLTDGAQPIISYNYGAGDYKRVSSAIKFMSVTCVTEMVISWAILYTFPSFFISIFNSNAELIHAGLISLKIYFIGFFMMALQFSGQSVFVALGKSKQAVFFSIFRKIIIVVPLTLILPKLFNLGIYGVFLSEPISNIIGGIASFTTMLCIVHKEFKSEASKESKTFES